MSTEDPNAAPRTRAEARAARAATEAAVEAKKVPEIPAAEPIDVPAVPPVAEPARSVPAPVEAPEPATPSAPKNRRFLYSLLAVIAVLVLVVAGLGIVSLFQGPRLSQVQVDPAEAIDVSGSRVILTANQSLQEIDAAQVTVEPAAPFTVDAAGRNVGIRFTVPLDDATDYTVSVAGVIGTGGGPASNLETKFATPAAEVFLLNRTADDDTIFRTDLSGNGVPVFTHARINDYRATRTHLVVAVEDGDTSKILVMDRDGKNERELPLPGDGLVSTVQVSDRGGLVAYTYSDRKISETSGRASVLVTQSITGNDEPHIVAIGGKEASIAEWQFVPDSAAVVFIDFAGTLSLDDRAGDAGPQNLGIAMRLLGVSRGTYTAIIERADGSTIELNLADGSEMQLSASVPDYGPATTITPYPGGTLRHVVARDPSGLPTGQATLRVDDDGTATPLLEVVAGNAILQACASPSGQYAAVTVAPKLIENAYDDMHMPLPKTLQTHLMDLRSGKELVVLTGFDVSWCQMAPGF
ncbi:hypothetical protein DC31_03385 [Microbacterium sp. CH12i]|uniref:hypothetical protein n=1 Tax=Microbacterium sp. CH12i TaxID=1479651 RepID=UPI000460BAC3|nr:hypothetical protein [Microbacterium sp. CH12i]KDA05065.1 hypothetical protein DC31_03385 [Microbacterium sp. CH12i]